MFKKWFSKEQSGQSNKVLTPRAPRMPVGHLSFIRLEINSRPHELINLSTSGLGFASADGSLFKGQPTRISVSVALEGQAYSLEIEVVRQSGGMAGARWGTLPEDFRRRLFKLLEPEKVAMEMVPMKPEMLEAQEDGTPHYFGGKSGNEIYFVVAGHSVVRGTLIWFGHQIDFYSDTRPAVQAHAKRNEVLESARTSVSTPPLALSETDRIELIGQVTRFVRVLPGLDPVVRQSLLGCLAL